MPSGVTYETLTTSLSVMVRDKCTRSQSYIDSNAT
jgi:hypothetical protein